LSGSAARFLADGHSSWARVHRWKDVVDSQFRHPKFAALLTLAALVVGLVAVMGPRNGGVTGVGDVSAGEDGSAVTSTSDPNQGDGVVFTTPGELVEVIEGPPGPEVTSATSALAGSQGAPSTTSAAPAQEQTTTSAVPTSAPTSTPSTAVESGTEPDGSNGPVDETAAADPADQIVPVVVDADNAVLPAFSLLSVPTLAGSAKGGPAPDEVVLGQLGTRDSNSTPWMLLIGANFLIAGSALAALRLRR